MQLTTFAGLTAATFLFLCVLFLLIRRWKNVLLELRFSKALQAENNGDSEKAIQLYQEALQRGQGLPTGNKRLLSVMERRLKTLRTSTEFVQSFRRTELVC